MAGLETAKLIAGKLLGVKNDIAIVIDGINRKFYDVSTEVPKWFATKATVSYGVMLDSKIPSVLRCKYTRRLCPDGMVQDIHVDRWNHMTSGAKLAKRTFHGEFPYAKEIQQNPVNDFGTHRINVFCEGETYPLGLKWVQKSGEKRQCFHNGKPISVDQYNNIENNLYYTVMNGYSPRL